jgi:hypothetical protein
MFAASAHDRPAQGEVFVDVLAFGSNSSFVFAGLHLLKDFERNQRLMVSFATCDAPWLMFDISGINYTVQDIADLLLANFLTR